MAHQNSSLRLRGGLRGEWRCHWRHMKLPGSRGSPAPTVKGLCELTTPHQAALLRRNYHSSPGRGGRTGKGVAKLSTEGHNNVGRSHPPHVPRGLEGGHHPVHNGKRCCGPATPCLDAILRQRQNKSHVKAANKKTRGNHTKKKPRNGRDRHGSGTRGCPRHPRHPSSTLHHGRQRAKHPLDVHRLAHTVDALRRNGRKPSTQATNAWKQQLPTPCCEAGETARGARRCAKWQSKMKAILPDTYHLIAPFLVTTRPFNATP